MLHTYFVPSAEQSHTYCVLCSSLLFREVLLATGHLHLAHQPVKGEQFPLAMTYCGYARADCGYLTSERASTNTSSL